MRVRFQVRDRRLPALPVQAAHLAATGLRTARRLAAGEALGVSRVVQDRRLAVCRGCMEFLAPDPDKRGLGRCRMCGCWLRWKTILAGEPCPLGKW